jgi:hypothetical protein
MTAEHQTIVGQFLAFKRRTAKDLAMMETHKNKNMQATLLFAQCSPVWESEYILEEREDLQLYNCLIPEIKTARRLKFDLREDYWKI